MSERTSERSLTSGCVNGFLTKLPEDVCASLISRAELVHLPSLRLLYRAREIPSHVHFLTSGVASILTTLADGRTLEVGLVGCEGVPESFHLVGLPVVTTEAIMQVEGMAMRVAFSVVKRLVGETGVLHALLFDRICRQGLIAQQLAACAQFHELVPRLARWLLMLEDRVGEPVFAITQEALATMIGVRRPTLNVAAGKLERMGLVQHDRGLVRIANRQGLEQIACECYKVVQELIPG